MDRTQAKQLLNEITLQIPASKSGSLTPAGQTKQALKPATIESINGVFELLSSIYGNQFFAAYPSTEQSNIAKRLWAKHLNNYPANLLMAVADKIIANETFLPSLAKFKEYCDGSLSIFGLADAHSAYMEACRAPKPKSEYNWSHPAVYYAGLATDWFFLAGAIESQVFPIFKRNYQVLCDRVLAGEDIEIAVPMALPEEIEKPMSLNGNKKSLKALREKLDL